MSRGMRDLPGTGKCAIITALQMIVLYCYFRSLCGRLKGDEGLSWYVYMLRCGDGSLYTGSTTDVEKRLAVHQSGKGAKYTRSRPPVELVYTEMAADRSAAFHREAAIKKLTRAEKLKLLEKENGYETEGP